MTVLLMTQFGPTNQLGCFSTAVLLTTQELLGYDDVPKPIQSQADKDCLVCGETEIRLLPTER